MRFIRYINEGIGKILYHGTTEENAEKIIKQGFKTGMVKGSLGSNSISFTVDKDDWERFGDVAVKWKFSSNLEKRFLDYENEKVRYDFFDFCEGRNKLSSRYTLENLKAYGNYVGIREMEKKAIEYRVYDISVIKKKDLFI